MSKRQPEKTSIARRKLLAGGIALAGSVASAPRPTASANAGDDNLPPHVPTWMKEQGAPFLSPPYGQPSPFEKNVIRRPRAPTADEYCGLIDDAMAEPAWDPYTEWSAFRAASCWGAGDRSGSGIG
jgi:hypothetical protein